MIILPKLIIPVGGENQELFRQSLKMWGNVILCGKKWGSELIKAMEKEERGQREKSTRRPRRSNSVCFEFYRKFALVP